LAGLSLAVATLLGQFNGRSGPRRAAQPHPWFTRALDTLMFFLQSMKLAHFCVPEPEADCELSPCGLGNIPKMLYRILLVLVFIVLQD